jgi:Flp pilus assembly pilin Flp
MERWMRGFLRVMADDRGQTLAEYGLIISLVAAVAVTAAVFYLRESIVSAFNGAASCLGGTC